MAHKSKWDTSDDDEGKAGHGGALWMISYIDLLSLLLAFFVLLYTLSNVDKGKFEALSQALGNAVGKDAAVPIPEAFKQEDLVTIFNDLKAYFEKNKLQDRVTLAMTPEGLRISMSASFFEIGENQLLPDGLEVLRAIALQLRYKTYKIRIEGHSDNVPIATEKYPSNWFLSAARSCSVVQYLTKAGVQPSRLSAVGLADQAPVAPNDSPENRSKNRRIEMIILRFKGE